VHFLYRRVAFLAREKEREGREGVIIGKGGGKRRAEREGRRQRKGCVEGEGKREREMKGGEEGRKKGLYGRRRQATSSRHHPSRIFDIPSGFLMVGLEPGAFFPPGPRQMPSPT
jgi:hypothetical protein